MGVSAGSLGRVARETPGAYESRARARAKTRVFPSGLHTGSQCTKAGSSAPGSAFISSVRVEYQARIPRVG